MLRSIRTPICLFIILFTFPAPLWAAQVVVLMPQNMGSKAGTAVAQAMATALSAYDGFTAISPFELRSLLQHEANRQALGCSATDCMRGIAKAMGAELVLASSREKRQLRMSLMSVSDGKVLARTSTAMNKTEATKLPESMGKLAKTPLPSAAQGPDWLSRRSFRAVVLGFLEAAMQGDEHLSDSRKRIVADIIHTELDVDADPKIKVLLDSIEAKRDVLQRRTIGASNSTALSKLQMSAGWFDELNADAARAKEVRARARAKGMRPTMGLMRFPQPEPVEPPNADALRNYLKTSSTSRAIVSAAALALGKADLKNFQKAWKKDNRDIAIKIFSEAFKVAGKSPFSCERLPDELLTQAHVLRATKAKDDLQIVFVRCVVNKRWQGVHTVEVSAGNKLAEIVGWKIAD